MNNVPTSKNEQKKNHKICDTADKLDIRLKMLLKMSHYFSLII